MQPDPVRVRDRSVSFIDNLTADSPVFEGMYFVCLAIPGVKPAFTVGMQGEVYEVLLLLYQESANDQLCSG